MFSKKLLATSVSAVTLALVGCGASDQDTGSSGSNVQLSGLVVDPYISGATVYVDLNNNGIRDNVLEKKALTDKDGYFSKSKPDASGNQIDYCANEVYERYCLRTTQLSDDAVLRIEGGYDVATGQPFTGSLVVDLNLNGAPADVGAANPLTSLFVSATEAQEAAILTFIGATKEQLTEDFLSGDSFNSERFRRAMQVHKAVAIMTTVLDTRYALEAGKEFNDKKLPATSGKYVYEAVATLLANTTTPTASTNTNTTAIDNWAEALESAETTLRSDVTSLTSTSAMTPNSRQAVGNRVAALFNWLKDTTSITSTSSQDDLYKNARVADFAVGQVKREAKAAKSSNSDITSTDNAVITGVLGDTGTGGTFDVNNFGKDADLDSLIKASSTPTSVSTFSTGTELFSDTSGSEKTVAAQVLKMDYADSDSTKQGNAYLYFSALSSAVDTQGSVTLCVNAVGDDSDLKDLEAIKTGLYIAGSWNRLNDYSVTVSLDLPGVPDQPLIIKRTALGATLNDKDSFQFALDSTGDLETWTGSLAPFNSTAPSTDDACAAELPDLIAN
ncbi:hypothetical protein [Oceanospirillum sanctuarii]|uniref:hypothetical protein n=1 Tax=Oceanospirillum sanctuarii TaxID=1434821 RepID=UPI000A37818E|nr:hypothetical protein [Oceanospirillum sanctuarii]